MPSYMPKTLHKKTRYLEGHSCNAVQVIPNTVTDTGSGWADCQQMFTSPDILGKKSFLNKKKPSCCFFIPLISARPVISQKHTDLSAIRRL